MSDKLHDPSPSPTPSVSAPGISHNHSAGSDYCPACTHATETTTAPRHEKRLKDCGGDGWCVELGLEQCLACSAPSAAGTQPTPDFHTWLTRVHGFKVGAARNSYSVADLESAWNAGISHRPEVIGASPLCLDCHSAGIRNCSHFDNCNGKWVYRQSGAAQGTPQVEVTPEPPKVEEAVQELVKAASAILKMHTGDNRRRLRAAKESVEALRSFPSASQTPEPTAFVELGKLFDRLKEDMGWRGHGPNKDIFYCEYCHQSHEDCTKILHLEYCHVMQLRSVINWLATPASTARTDALSLHKLCHLLNEESQNVMGTHYEQWASGLQRAITLIETGIEGGYVAAKEIASPEAPGSVPQAPKCSEPRIVELNPPNAPDKYAVFIGKVFIWEFDFEKEAEELRDNLKRVGVPQAEPPKSELEEMRHQLKVKDIAATAIAVVLRARCSDREWDNLPEEMRVQTDRVTELVERAEAAEKRVKELAGAAQSGDDNCGKKERQEP